MIQKLFTHIDELKEKIDKVRPLAASQAKQLNEYFKIGLTYSSNALEGNTLTISETKVLLEEGITTGAKPMKYYMEAQGHAKAFEYMLNLSKPNLIINEDMIKQLHLLFYSGIDMDQAGVYRKEDVYITGTEYLPPKPGDVPVQMSEIVKKINVLIDAHPVERAALAHKYLVDVHPFIDGNTRTARLLMNLILSGEGYGVATIPPILRNEYIETLQISQRNENPNNEPFIMFIAQCVLETQKDYCRLLRI